VFAGTQSGPLFGQGRLGNEPNTWEGKGKNNPVEPAIKYGSRTFFRGKKVLVDESLVEGWRQKWCGGQAQLDFHPILNDSGISGVDTKGGFWRKKTAV